MNIRNKCRIFGLKFKLFFTINPEKRKALIERIKCLLIAIALEAPEGREALAKAMVEPIRKSIGYKAVLGG